MNSFIRRYLDPAERMSELLFGLVMTLTFTLGASLVIKEGPDATRELLVGVLGCNIAWGIIDGILYVFNAMFSRGAANRIAHSFKSRGRDSVAQDLDSYLMDTYGEAVSSSTRENMKRDIMDFVTGNQPAPVKLKRDDLFGALASFTLVVFTSIPAILPFFVFDDRLTALRASNFLMVALIYWIGYQWAASIDAHRQKVGISMAIGCLVIVQLTIMLGG